VMTPFGFELAGSDLMATGNFEKEEIDCFLQYIPAAAACIDVGANVGLYSCLAASRGKHVVAVEPLVSNLRVLLQNLFRNGFVNAEVYPLGLASAPGIARLYGGGTGASFLPGWAATPENWNRIVPLTTLDILTGARFDGRPLFIKVDVEGFELEVLKGSKRILAMDPKPIWMVEICLNEHFRNGLNDHFYETFELFWRHGYQSRVAVLQQRVVQPEDVARWMARGSVDFGSHNYLFVHV
jgi:FkbM family methyltransferase